MAAPYGLLIDIDPKAWDGLRVEAVGGKPASIQGKVMSLKSAGWANVSFEGQGTMARRANELALLSDCSHLPRAAKSSTSPAEGRAHAHSGGKGGSAAAAARERSSSASDSEDSEDSSGSSGDSSDGTPTAMRSLVGESVRIVHGEGAGKLGFVAARSGDDVFTVKVRRRRAGSRPQKQGQAGG